MCGDAPSLCPEQQGSAGHLKICGRLLCCHPFGHATVSRFNFERGETSIETCQPPWLMFCYTSSSRILLRFDRQAGGLHPSAAAWNLWPTLEPVNALFSVVSHDWHTPGSQIENIKVCVKFSNYGPYVERSHRKSAPLSPFSPNRS